MILEVNGLVTKVIPLPGADKLLCIYTFEKGMMTVMAKGTKTFLSHYAAGAELFCYSHFILYKRSDRYWVREVELLEHFFSIRQSLARTALAAYVCDVIADGATNQADIPFLRLALNTLFAIANETNLLPLIKASFELRAVSILGFMPELHDCNLCGKEQGEFMLYVMDGVIVCDSCREKRNFLPPQEGENRIVEILSPGSLSAMRYVVSAPLEKLFSFRLDEQDLHLFSKAAESYITNHLERGFKSLSFYHQVKD